MTQVNNNDVIKGLREIGHVAKEIKYADDLIAVFHQTVANGKAKYLAYTQLHQSFVRAAFHNRAIVVIRLLKYIDPGLSYVPASHAAKQNPSRDVLQVLFKEEQRSQREADKLLNYVKKNMVIHESPVVGHFNLGAHVFPYGGALVRGMNLTFFIRGETIELRFKLNHVHRQQLQKTIDLYHSSSHPKGVTFVRKFYRNPGEEGHFRSLWSKRSGLDNNGVYSRHQLKILGFGEISIGDGSASNWIQHEEHSLMVKYEKFCLDKNEKDIYRNLHHEVVVRASSMSRIRTLLFFFNLDGALRPSTKDEMKRMYYGQVFRSWHPREAHRLEKSLEFFNSSLSQLKGIMEKLAPGISKKLNTKIKTIEIFPGRYRLCMPGLTKEVQKAGGLGLVHFADVKHLPSILQTGLISAETRYQLSLQKPEFAPGNTSDWREGSADSIFARLITPSELKRHNEFENTFETSDYDAALVLSMDLLETGTYQHYEDNEGSRLGEDYANRPSVVELTKWLQTEKGKRSEEPNEVMIKDAVAPSRIERCIVATKQQKDNLIKGMNVLGLVKNGKFNGKPIDQFILVGKLKDGFLTKSRL